MSLPAPQRLSAEEYLRIERDAERKSEFFNGQMFAMAGGSPAHNLISMNVGGELHQRLKASPCRVYPSDMRVSVTETGLYTYPDVTVVCGEQRFKQPGGDTLLNPTLLVEVLSPGTERYDRGEKCAHYRRLESLREYVLISQDRVRVECFTRSENGDGWLLTEVDSLQGVLRLRSIDVELALADVYAKVDFEESGISLREQP